MATRSRERKNRELAERQAVKQEMTERHLEQTAPFRRMMKWAGLVVGGILIGGGLIWGGIALAKNINPIVRGPFGEIKSSELKENDIATVETTKGNIKIQLDTKNTPKTAANFVLLAKKNFYDGIKFHRVIKGFMVQTGDPNSKDNDPKNDGTGGPDYAFDDEEVVGEYVRGAVAMANSGPNTNGSQFFIVQEDTELPKNYVIFGQVIEGMETVDQIGEVEVETNEQNENSRPKEAILIDSVTLSASGSQ